MVFASKSFFFSSRCSATSDSLDTIHVSTGEFESTQDFEAALLLPRFSTAHATQSVMHPRTNENIRMPSPSESIGGRHDDV
jgi:hypothetical protein